MEACSENGLSSPSETPGSTTLDTIRSRLKEICERQNTTLDFFENTSSDHEQFLQQCLRQFMSNFEGIESDFSGIDSLGLEDLDLYLEHLKKELNLAETENAKISDEIEALNGRSLKEFIQLESDLGEMNSSLKLIDIECLDQRQECLHARHPVLGENQEGLVKAHEDLNFKIFELDCLIEKSKSALNSLSELEYMFKRLEAVGQIEDLLSGVKVIEFESNHIRLAMETSIPNLEGLSYLQKLDFVNEPSVIDHELVIQLEDEMLLLKNVEIFPNDVYIGEVIEAAKSVRLSIASFSLQAIDYSLEWLVRKVRQRILLCSVRHLIVKDASKSRHTFEYFDKDEMVVAHLVGNINAFIKISEGWPLSTSLLKLVSLKSSDIYSKGISLDLLCEVEGLANSLDAERRTQLTSFTHAIEEILIQQKHSQQLPIVF